MQTPRFFRSATLTIITANILFFFIVSLISIFYPEIFEFVALQPSKIIEMPWTLITSMFMHANPLHLFMNMFSLLFLGGFLERIIGKRRFLTLYFLSGLLGSIFYILAFYLTGANDLPAVGASGAIFGLGGMLAVITPRMPVYIMFIPVAMPMWFGVTLSLALLWLLSFLANLPIGNTAHLGGLAAGLFYAFYLRRKHRRRFRMISNHFSH
jgi:membrane associated rhomboid family serine protease